MYTISSMKIRTCISLVVICHAFVTLSHAQPRNYDIQNFIGLGGGVTQFDIQTDNFTTSQSSGWFVSATAEGDLPNKWFNVSYSLTLSENKFDISGRLVDDVSGDETIRYKMFATQAGFSMHIKPIGPVITFDLGPQIQYNGKLVVDDEQKENYFLNPYDLLQAKEISDISQFNINAMGGVSLNLGRLKLRGQYVYGLTNMLNKLNSQNLNDGGGVDYRGNQSQLLFGALVTF